MPLPPKTLFIHSLSRCKKNAKFMDIFYERFLSSSDEIAEKFKYTDFERQHKMLLHSLEVAAEATQGNQDALHMLSEQAELHSRENLDIRPALYRNWLDAIIATAAEVDPRWDATVEAAWRVVLEHVIFHMSSKY